MLERTKDRVSVRQSEGESRERPSTIEEATFAERQFGPMTRQTVAQGKKNPERYESFSMQKFEWTDENVMWVCFIGLGNVIEEKRPGEGLSFVPSIADLIPKQGTSFVFNGPSGIAGYTPEQCIRSTEAALDAVYHLADLYPDKKIRIQGFSSGTHLATYIANKLGERRGEAIDRLELLSPGESIADGIYSTWVTEPLAKDLQERGITQKAYNEAIHDYTQRENIKYLPAGRSLVIHAGTADTFIPTDKKGGPNDFVDLLRKANKHPTYVLHPGKDHVTLPLAVIVGEHFGKDPLYLKKNRDAWENPATFTDELFMRSVQSFLSRFTEDGLRKMALLLAERNAGIARGDMKLHERAVAEGLASLGLGEFTPKEQFIGIEKNESVGEILQDSKKRKAVETNLRQSVAFVKEIGRSDIIVPQYEKQTFKDVA